MHILLSYCCIDIICRHNESTIGTIISLNKQICKKYFAHNIMYFKASTDLKISTFLEKNEGWGCGSWNGPLSDLKCTPWCRKSVSNVARFRILSGSWKVGEKRWGERWWECHGWIKLHECFLFCLFLCSFESVWWGAV